MAVYSQKKIRETVASKKTRSGERAGTFELLTSRRLRRHRMTDKRKKNGVQMRGGPACASAQLVKKSTSNLCVPACCSCAM